MAVSEEQVAELYAALGFKVNAAEWSKGGQAIDGLQKRLSGLEGVFQDRQGRWRAANGRFFTAQERAALGLGNAVDGVGAKAKSAGDQVSGLWHLALMAAAYTGIEHAGHALIGFNSEVQDAKISLSAMLSGQLSQDWQTAQRNANALYDEFQRFSTLTPVTTQQILEFGKSIAAATFQAGGGVEELKNLTEQGVIAAKVLAGNRGAGYVELEMSEMLAGTITRRMMFARQLLGMGKISEEQFKAMSGKERITALQKILNSDAMVNARNAFGKSFTGVTSTLWDKLQIAFGKVGLPLFEAITAKVAQLNTWMDKNRGTIERYAKSLGGTLVSAFNKLLVAIRFVSDHADFFEGVLIGLGAFITAFAVQAAIDWAIAFWPITLAVAAIAALHAAIKWLDGDADDTADAFDAWIPKIEKINGELDKLRNGKPIPNASGDASASAALHDFNGNPIDEEWAQRYRYGESSAERPRATLGQASSQVTVRPQVNVQVTGNMPPGWIDTKIQTAIDDHHETTWNNAANALQADDEE